MNDSVKDNIQTAIIKKQPFSVGEEIELTIDSLSFGGGRGVGRKNGFVVFVPNVAPDEVVIAKIHKAKKNFAEAHLVKVVTPSIHRREPLCPVATECGGCTWQHVNYQAQLQQKYLIVQKALAKLNKLTPFSVLPVLASPEEWRYRNRIQIHKEGNKIGFLKTKSKDLVPINDCFIADPKLTEMFSELAQNPSDEKRIELALDQNGETHQFSGKTPPHLSLFSQVNRLQNNHLIQLVLDHIRRIPTPTKVLDLYAGSGNFSLPMAAIFPKTQVTAVELSLKASRRAQKTAPENLKFITSDVGDFLSHKKTGHFDYVLLDPPRNGCDLATITGLIKMSASHLVYISCNPLTLARDLELLNGTYKTETVQPIDMFPQTDHIETLVTLSLR